MELRGISIGMGMTAAFEAIAPSLSVMDALCAAGANVVPVFSYHLLEVRSPYVDPSALRASVRRICDHAPVTQIQHAKKQAKNFDLLMLCPCTLDSLQSLLQNLSSSPPLTAARVMLSRKKPILICPYVRCGADLALPPLCTLLSRKNLYVAPFCQDGRAEEFDFLHAREDLIVEAAELALEGKQLQPVLRERKIAF